VAETTTTMEAVAPVGETVEEAMVKTQNSWKAEEEAAPIRVTIMVAMVAMTRNKPNAEKTTPRVTLRAIACRETACLGRTMAIHPTAMLVTQIILTITAMIPPIATIPIQTAIKARINRRLRMTKSLQMCPILRIRH
jgi:hypothetical protein